MFSNIKSIMDITKNSQPKKAFFSVLFILFVFFTPQLSFGQVTVPSANTNNGSVNDPLGSFFGYERTALIYTSAEIGTTGTIGGIGFYLNAVNSPGASTNVRIYMKMRTTLFAAASTYATETTGATLVYGPTTIAAGTFVAGGWVSIPLATTFNYTGGANNLEIIVETNATGSGSGEGSTGKQFRYTTQGSNQYFQNWNQDTTAPTGNGSRSTNRANVQLHFVPTITSLGATNGCPGSSITINGTNLSGATAANVTIGGTAVSSITSNSGTVLVAVIGAGTTGTVSVATVGGTATSAATFTINPVPVITSQPVATSSCTTGSTAFSVTATGATTYQWRRAGVNLTNVAPYSGVDTNTLTITNPAVGIAGSFDVVVSNAAPCSVTSNSVALTVVGSVPAASVTPSPTNAATGVCYSGTGAISSVSWAATATATSYDVYFGAGSLPGVVTSNVATNSYTCGTLAANTTYYWKVVAKNICGDAVGSTQWTFTTASLPCASCTPSSSSASTYINNFSTTLGLVNITNNGTGYATSPNGYRDYTATQIVSQCPGSSVNISFTLAGGSAGFNLWVDWNDNGVFTDAGENMLTSGGYLATGTHTGSFTVPAAATSGNHRMRIIVDYWSTNPNSCTLNASGPRGEAEDYTFTVNTPIITVQPTTPATVNCESGTRTISVTATNATSYQWRRAGVNLTNVAPYSGVNTNTLTITDPTVVASGSFDVVVSNAAPCSVTSNAVTLTVITTPVATTGPVPANAATGVCYSGSGAVTSLSWTAVTSAASYNVYFGTSATPPFITNQLGTTYSTGTLLPNTTYYWQIIAKNFCGDSTTSSIWSFTTATTPCASCTPSSSSNSTYINNFSTTLGIGNITNNGTGYATSPNGYRDYTATKIVSQYNSSSVTVAFTLTTGGSAGVNIWVDWNDDGDFVDAGERVITSAGYITSGNYNGTFAVPATAAFGNHRMRIVADYWASNPSSCTIDSFGPEGEAEDYTLTVIPQFCTANPSAIAINVTTNTTATVTWTAASPAPSNGYQYYLSTSNVSPAYGTTPTGSTAAGVTTVNLTGLTPGTTYYIWVRSYCGVTDGPGAWVGPVSFFVPLCTIGNSIGTTALACPSVVAGGVGLSGADPVAITCTSGSCTDLEATYLALGSTSTYRVESIAYNPPYQFNCLKNPVSVNTDDIWSPVVNLPFTFCFYGNTYTSCIIGSNGIIRFGSNGSAGGASGWSYNANLPSTAGALFANSIYGAYHDIDPSVGGEIGWELITLNTGCRALVASWSDVPMYYDNSKLYSGMMVFYENTNVIEVYIKNKVIDGGAPWNNGNAIIGVQNSTATQAVVAPNRNGLSTNWTATNEAWRFVPDGTSITSVKWYAGAVNPANIVGTTDVINVCPTITTTYTAEITYTSCSTGTTFTQSEQATVTVIGNKTWTGAVDINWNEAGNWSPVGIPTALDCVIIPNVTNDPTITGLGGLAYSLTVQNGGFLTVNSNNNSLTVTDFVNVNAGGIFNIEDDGSLIQVNSAAVNVGNINSKRNATILTELDYVYWCSPVGGNTPAGTAVIDNIASPNTLRRIYTWNPTTSNGNGGIGNYVDATGSTMALAKGYIAQPPNGFTGTLSATFTGVPNNGNISYTVSRGAYTAAPYNGTNGTQITNLSDNLNLVGNPYPSSISANQFLVDNSGVIQDGIQVWRHGIAINSATGNPFYGTYHYNYSPNDFLKINITGNNSGDVTLDNYKVGSGQSFFVTMIDGGATTGVINFNNSLRSSTYNNSTFYRDSQDSGIDYDNLERHRIWLDIVGSNQSHRSLVGYIEGATDGEDTLYDFHTYVANGVLSMYSLINGSIVDIQGKSLPFNENNIIPLGYNAPAAGSYTIAIAAVDGLFTGNQKIFLEDKLLNIIYDLRAAPYVFNTEAGNFDTRFVLRYTDRALGNEQYELNNSVKIVTNDKAVVYSSNQNIQSIIVYDILGRKIDSYDGINSKQFTLKHLSRLRTTLIMKITLEDGVIVTRKFIF